MISTTFKSTGSLSSRNSNASANVAYGPACYAAEATHKARAKRVANAIATLRILVPVALITAIVISGRLPEARIGSAMAAIAETTAVTNASAYNYFPAQFVNQGAGGEQHVPNF